MGTYTSNYNLFMPSIGEQGWGELVNNNFSTIDTAMAGLNIRMGTAETNITSLTTRMGTAETTITSNKSRIGTLETEADALDARVTVLEKGEFLNNVLGVESNTSTYFGALYIQTNITIVSAGKDSGATKTLTYRKNPFSNTVTFSCVGASSGTANGRAYVTRNGTTIVDAGTAAKWSTSSKSVTVTLNEGDVLYFYAYSANTSGAIINSRVTMVAGGIITG